MLRIGLFDGPRHRPIGELCDVAERYGAMTYLDEVHAAGLYGARRRHCRARRGHVPPDLIQGMIGGYVAGSAALIEFPRSHAPDFIFTTSLPPALAAIRHLKQSQAERERHQERAATLN